MKEPPHEVKKNRQDQLKYFIDLADNLLDYNKKIHKETKRSNWKVSAIEFNIKTLENLKIEILKYLEEEHLGRYVKFYLEKQSPFFSEFMLKSGHSYQLEILKCSPYYNIYSDIQWMPDKPFTVGDSIEIALGKKELNFLDSHLPEKIKKVKSKVLSSLKELNVENSFHELICEAIENTIKGKIIVSNLLLFPVIEGIVTSGLRDIYILQNANVGATQIEDKFNSFPSLADKIIKLDWKKDFTQDIFYLGSNYSHVPNKSMDQVRERINKHLTVRNRLSANFSEMEHLITNTKDKKHLLDKFELLKQEAERIMRDNIGEEDRSIEIGVDTEFHFLVNRLREDRNELLHGNLAEYGKKYQNYIYFSALEKSIESLLKYKEVYND